MKPEKRSREARRKDKRKNEQARHAEASSSKPFLQAPVILERRDKTSPPSAPAPTTSTTEATSPPPHQEDGAPAVKIAKSVSSILPSDSNDSRTEPASRAPVPFFRRHTKFNSEAVLKLLSEQPGHFVVGIVGQQGVGKSTILNSFMDNPKQVFPVSSPESMSHSQHTTTGIDMYITEERMILLDTEALFSCSVLDQTLRKRSLEGVHPDLWLEIEALYTLVFMLSVCNVVIIAWEGAEVDYTLVQFVKRAETLKSALPDVTAPNPASQPAQSDTVVNPDIVFVCNKCRDWEFTRQCHLDMELVLSDLFQDSNLKTSGLVSLGNYLPLFERNAEPSSLMNIYFLPYSPAAPVDDGNVKGHRDIWRTSDNVPCGVESFDDLALSLRDQVSGAPRRSIRKGQLSEKEWFRNAVKTYDLIRRSDYISDYVKIMRKLRDG